VSAPIKFVDNTAKANAAFAKELARERAEGDADYMRNEAPRVTLAPLPDRPVKPNAHGRITLAEIRRRCGLK
jgi:hypothetical protein